MNLKKKAFECILGKGENAVRSFFTISHNVSKTEIITIPLQKRLSWGVGIL